MIASDECRRVFEQDALEYCLSEEEKLQVKSFGCCDNCSPDQELWPDSHEDTQNYSVGTKKMVDVLSAYFNHENKLVPQLESCLTITLAKQIRRFWKCPDFKFMLKTYLNQHYLNNISDIVEEFRLSGNVTGEAESEDDDDDFDDDFDDSISSSDESSESEVNDENSSDSD